MKSLYFKVLNFFQEFKPKSLTCFQEGYSKEFFYNDLIAGISIGIISLPLVMAFAIASGLPPERGLFTGIVGGLLVSLLGGSRFQIAGPTGAFVVIVYGIVEQHGYEGLALSTLMAGGLLLVFGFLKAGRLLKYIPFPVITGFTAGIALNLFCAQLKDFFGLPIQQVSPGFIDKWIQYSYNFQDGNAWAFGIGSGCLALIFILKAVFPKIPGIVVAIGLGTAAAHFLNLPVETVQTKFGLIPSMLPAPSISFFSWDKLSLLFPDAMTIALLAAVESILSCSVADGMTKSRHRPNAELFAQGIANLIVPIFGGIPVTGAIARTAANIRIGAKSSLAGIIHAATLFFFMVFLADETSKIPLATLAAALMYIAWNMVEKAHAIAICNSSKSDMLLLASSFLLTVLVDLTVAVQVGVVLAALLFMKKMSDTTKIHATRPENTPENVAVFEINGPLFYGIAHSLEDQIYSQCQNPKVLILQLHNVPHIDASGIYALEALSLSCKTRGIQLLISGVKESHKDLFFKTGLQERLLS